MREGWHGEDYVVLFDESELTAASERYEVSRLLPGFMVVGYEAGMISLCEAQTARPIRSLLSLSTRSISHHFLFPAEKPFCNLMDDSREK